MEAAASGTGVRRRGCWPERPPPAQEGEGSARHPDVAGGGIGIERAAKPDQSVAAVRRKVEVREGREGEAADVADAKQDAPSSADWLWWILTTIRRSKVCCPAIGRRASEVNLSGPWSVVRGQRHVRGPLTPDHCPLHR